MCIAAFVWQAHPLYSLLLLHNRDELDGRPSEPVAWWDGCEILGGKDLVAGGTWLACTKSGRVAFLTNVLEKHSIPDAKSRGNLPVRFLESTKSPKEFAEEVAKVAREYNGFNLILADIPFGSMVYVTNRPEGEPPAIQEVSPGLHVLTNAHLDTPWPKSQRLRLHFLELLDKYGKEEIPVKELVELMRDRVKVDDERMLPRIRSVRFEFSISSIFVTADISRGGYHTRSTIALAVTRNGEVRFYETYLEDEMWKEQTVIYWIQKLK